MRLLSAAQLGPRGGGVVGVCIKRLVVGRGSLQRVGAGALALCGAAVRGRLRDRC